MLTTYTEAPEASFLEHSQITSLIAAVRDSPEENAIIHLGLFAGLRRGEIFPLQWVDVEGGRVRIRRSYRQGVMSTPKTKASARVVDLPESVLRSLEVYRASRPALDTDYIFRKEQGGPLSPNVWYRNIFAAIRERAGLPSSIGLHSLRHTYASLLILQGENVKYVSRQLGHSSIQITADTYGHLFEQNSRTAMAKLEGAISDLRRETFRVVG